MKPAPIALSLAAGASLAPTLVLAQSGTLFSLIGGVSVLINQFLLPLVLTLAVLFFIYNVVRYFIAGSADPDGRAKARRFMLWSVLGFVIIGTLWSIVLFVIEGVGFTDTPCQRVDTYVASENAPCRAPLPGSPSGTPAPGTAPAPGSTSDSGSWWDSWFGVSTGDNLNPFDSGRIGDGA